MKRKICVFTGTRAEYGLLRTVIKKIKQDDDLYLQLVVGGMHLSPEFGLTYHEIEEDGFRIDAKTEFLLSSDTPVGISKSMGLAMISLSEAFERLNPDILVGVGDRFEFFSAVAAAFVCRVPIAHISGGEITEGVMDDSFRHAITKISHIHFTSTEDYKRRVIQLGESPERVFNVGEVALDNIIESELLSRQQLEEGLNLNFKKRNLLVTFHPVTLEENTSQMYFQNLLDVLDELQETKIIFTRANADVEGRIINGMIDEYVSSRSEKSVVFFSLGSIRYLSLMRYVDAVVGNSSSGIVEAPSLQIGTINIGDRQKGRKRAISVIDCDSTVQGIRAAFRELYSHSFQMKLKSVINPFGDGRSSERIIQVLKEYDLKNIFKKSFYDIKV